MKRLSKQDKELVQRIDELRELLAEFGLALHGYDPGVSAVRKDSPHTLLNFNFAEWQWLEPLLIELRQHRTMPEKTI